MSIDVVEKASSVPSGDQDGLNPTRVTRLTASPVRPITKMPPPSLLDRNAMRSPSGENAGMSSSAGESLVRFTGFEPDVLCRKMSKLPSDSAPYAIHLPSGDRLGNHSRPGIEVNLMNVAIGGRSVIRPRHTTIAAARPTAIVAT